MCQQLQAAGSTHTNKGPGSGAAGEWFYCETAEEALERLWGDVVVGLH